jgi:hypothetical protein
MRGAVSVYVDARAICDALDVVFDGQWSTEVELLSEKGESQVAVTLTVGGGLIFTDVGTGDDAKNATSDGLKRAAAQAGIGRYLYTAEMPWVKLKYEDWDKEKKRAIIVDRAKVLTDIIEPFYLPKQ